MPSPALRVREGAPEVRWVYVRVHQRTRAHPARAPSGFSYAPSPRLTGPRSGGILPQKQPLARIALSADLLWDERSRRRSAGMHGFMDQGTVRGAEHRRPCRISPKGRGDGSPRLRSSTWMYCLSNPARARSARGFRRARSAAEHRVRCL